jgi:uncharacterized membrane protein
MTTAATVILAMSSPILVVIGLFMLAAWRDHRRGAMVARQIRLTDAIADELGLIVAPVVAKPLGGPWRVEIRVPVGRPATVSRIVAIAHDTLTRTGAGQYELVLTPEPARVHTLGGATRPARRPGRPRHGEAAARPRRRGPPAAAPPDPGRDRTGGAGVRPSAAARVRGCTLSCLLVSLPLGELPHPLGRLAAPERLLGDLAFQPQRSLQPVVQAL